MKAMISYAASHFVVKTDDSEELDIELAKEMIMKNVTFDDEVTEITCYKKAPGVYVLVAYQVFCEYVQGSSEQPGGSAGLA